MGRGKVGERWDEESTRDQKIELGKEQRNSARKIYLNRAILYGLNK